MVEAVDNNHNNDTEVGNGSEPRNGNGAPRAAVLVNPEVLNPNHHDSDQDEDTGPPPEIIATDEGIYR